MEFLTNHMSRDIYKVAWQYLWPKHYKKIVSDATKKMFDRIRLQLDRQVPIDMIFS